MGRKTFYNNERFGVEPHSVHKCGVRLFRFVLHYTTRCFLVRNDDAGTRAFARSLTYSTSGVEVKPQANSVSNLYLDDIIRRLEGSRGIGEILGGSA